MENSISANIALIDTIGKLETSVSNGANVKSCSKNAECGKRNDFVDGNFTSTAAIAKECVEKVVDHESSTKQNVGLE